MWRTLVIASIGFGWMAALPRAAGADHTIWHSPITAVQPGGANGTTVIASPHQALRVVSVSPAFTAATYNVPLTLPSDAEIDSITICYESPLSNTYVSQVTLTRMFEPTTNTTLLDDPTDHPGPGASCFSLDVADASANGLVTLTIQLVVGQAPTYWLELGAIGIKMKTAVTGVGHLTAPSHRLDLRQNRPNPFSAPTSIDFRIEQAARARLEVVDVQGRLLRTLVDRELEPGPHTEVWDGADDSGRHLPSGAYFYRLILDGQVGSRRMILLD